MDGLQGRLNDVVHAPASGPDSKSGAVSLRGVSKRFDQALAVDSVGLEIGSGEFLTLLGPSGCGKTTLLRMIGGFERPDSGRILIGDRDITTLPPERRPVNTVFQRYALFPHLNVYDNVAYGLRANGIAETAVRDKVGEALAMVDLSAFATRRIDLLSGGEAQRVALTRALVNRPSVLLLDEPLGALDLQLRKRMQIELRAIQRKTGATFLYVTHDQEEALVMSHRIAVMNHGRIVQVDEPETIHRRPRTAFVASFVGEGTLIPCAVIGTTRGRVDVRLNASGATTAAICGDDRGALTVGAPALVLVRPDAVKITEAHDALVTGRVVDRFYVGTAIRHVIELQDGTAVKADLAENLVRPVGSIVGLAWRPDAAVVVGEEDGP